MLIAKWKQPFAVFCCAVGLSVHAVVLPPQARADEVKLLPPARAIAPFDAAQAKAHQAAWANHLATTVETTNSIGQKFVLIPPGEFVMGASDAEIAEAIKVMDASKAGDGVKQRVREGEGPRH